MNKPIKVCFFTKYPPIEGGVSAQAYWISRALGQSGVEVHVVTNALEVEEEFKENIDFKNSSDRKWYQPKNVFVHNLNFGSKIHIPFSSAYLERLVNLGLKVIKKYDCDLIDSYYLQPYGAAAVFTKLLTGKPCILRHAGSDIGRLFPGEEFNALFRSIFKIADVIVTKNNDFSKINRVPKDNIQFMSFGGVDPEYFNPNIEKADLAELGVPRQLLKKPVLTYLGKYAPYKSLADIVKVASQIKEEFLLLFITGGPGLEEFKSHLRKIGSLKNKHYFLDFLPPWNIPALLRASACLLQLESDFPIKMHMPTQPTEAFAVATPVLMSDEIFLKYKRMFPSVKRNKNVLVVNPQDHLELKNTLLRIIKNPEKVREVGEMGYRDIFDKKRFGNALKEQISLYNELFKK